MEDLKLDCSFSRVAYLLDHIPDTRDNYLYLLLCYWQVFDGIEIPKDIVQTIVQNASQPETVSRSKRKVMERLRIQHILDWQRMAEEWVQVEAPDNS